MNEPDPIMNLRIILTDTYKMRMKIVYWRNLLVLVECSLFKYVCCVRRQEGEQTFYLERVKVPIWLTSLDVQLLPSICLEENLVIDSSFRKKCSQLRNLFIFGS